VGFLLLEIPDGVFIDYKNIIHIDLVVKVEDEINWIKGDF